MVEGSELAGAMNLARNVDIATDQKPRAPHVGSVLQSAVISELPLNLARQMGRAPDRLATLTVPDEKGAAHAALRAAHRAQTADTKS